MPKMKERLLFPSVWTLQRHRTCKISSLFLINRNVCYRAHDEVFLERCPELLYLLNHLFPCTSIDLFFLWPSSSISFLKIFQGFHFILFHSFQFYSIPSRITILQKYLLYLRCNYFHLICPANTNVFCTQCNVTLKMAITVHH